VTGNLEAVARLKLDRAGLGGWFAAGQGAFGSDAEDRAQLPAIARRRAGRLDGGAPYPRERTVVIGDTPRDIACARADGVRCVAVATGPYAAEELAGANAVARAAHELPALLRAG
jgi:phosphoglycolate phosphatase